MEDNRTSLMSARALSPGYEILWYTIEKVLGQGGFGITYLAHDRNLDRSVAIKEYLPTPFAYRHQDFSVKPLTGDHRDQFAWGLASFQKEAQTLAKFGHDNIVRVHSVFEQNNTAYMVMEYEKGDNLASVYQKRVGRLNQAFFQQIFFPIFDGLSEIHKFGFIHRDIKPANIYIRENDTPVLIDFGSARRTSRQLTGEMTTLVTQGYTPLEQYSSNYGDQGPWTDIYALSATIYEGVVGKKPDESLGRSACMLRSMPDLIQPLPAQSYPGYSQPFLDAVFAGLALEPEKRPQNLAIWLAQFSASGTSFSAAFPDRQPNYFSALDENDKTRMQPRQTPYTPQRQHTTESSAEEQGSWADELDKVVQRGGQQQEESWAHQMQSQANVPSKLKLHPLTQALALGNQRVGDGRNDRLDFSLHDDDFADDSGFYNAPPTQTGGAGNQQPNPDRYQDQSTKKKSRLPGVAIAASLLAGVLGVGGYFWLNSSGESVVSINTSMLSALPAPAMPMEVVLPKDLVILQLNTLLKMTDLLRSTSSLAPDNAELNQSIDTTYKRLAGIANQWNASAHSDVTEKILRVTERMPERGQAKTELLGLVQSSDQRSDSAALRELLSAGNLFPAGDSSVLNLISGLSESDLNAVSQSAQWKTMLCQFRQTALEKIKESDFDTAARVVAVGLTLQPEDEQFALLRNHLGRQQ